MAPHSRQPGSPAAIWLGLLPWAAAAAVSRNASAGVPPSPFSAMGCGVVRDRDENWIFSPGSGQWASCDLDVRSDAAFVCVDNGVMDTTSIFVDLASLDSKTGCFAWLTSDCTFDLKRVRQIAFELDLRNCEGVWAAPLWLCPDPWTPPGQLSGEVDLVEMCPRGSVATNFGSPGAPGENPQIWASAAGLGGPKKVTMTLDQGSGDLTTRVCNFDGSGCFDSAYYSNFLNVVNSAKGREHTAPYHFNVDVWNGYGGNPGWKACNAQNDPNSQCQFAVKHIRILTVDGSPMYTSGKCTALNDDSTAVESQPVDVSETLMVL